MRLIRVDEDFAHVVSQIVTDCARDHVAFLVDQEGRPRAFCGILDESVDLQLRVEVSLQFLGASAEPGRANDDAHVLGDLKTCEGLAHFFAFFAFDAFGDAARSWIVGHQDEVSSGKTVERCQCGPFVATLFLVDLDDEFLAFLDDVLDVDAPFNARRGNREVLSGDFLHRQKSVAVSTEFDKRRFEAGFYPRDFCLVDVGFFLFPVPVLDVEVVQLLAVNHRNPQLFAVCCVNKHSFHSDITWSWRFDRAKTDGISSNCVAWVPLLAGGNLIEQERRRH